MIKRFKQLSIGNKRLALVFSVIVSLLIAYLIDPGDFLELYDDDFWILWFFGFVVYWIFLRIILWIIDGYKKN